MRPTSPFLAAAFLLIAAAVQAQDSGIDALTRFYNEVDSLSAHFEQVQLASDGTVLRRSSGKFLLSRPGKFRWEYKKPYHQIIVSDGVTLKFYDVGLSQVTIRPVARGLRATPALLLTGGMALRQAFDVRLAGRHDGLTWLSLTPRSKHSDFNEIRLGLRDGLPVVMVLDDKLGQTTRIRFSDIQVNPDLDASGFDIDVPEGVTVVDTRSRGARQDQ